MRLVNIAYLQEGDVLARPVRSNLGTVLLGAGIKVTEYYIARLKELGFDMVFIEDDRLNDVEVDFGISSKTRDIAHETLRHISAYVADGQETSISAQRVQNVVKHMIDDLLSSRDILGNLHDIQGYDNYTFHHSINTTVVAVLLGMAAGYDDHKLLELGMGVIMHDVGKTLIPPEILNKTTRLTDYEFDLIRQHPALGFEILRRNQDFSLLSAHVALQHQEKWDGSGYPRGLKGYEIHEFGRIAAVADVYDALTSQRVYRNAIPPNEAYEYIIANSGSHFEPQVVKNFIKHIAVYPTGIGVVLSNGQRGNVIRQNKSFPNRPYVRVFSQDNEPLQYPLDYNLADHPSLMIMRLENQ